MAKIDQTLSALLESSLENITNRVSQPVESLGREKHVDDLCAHFVWNNGQRSVFLCPKTEVHSRMPGSADQHVCCTRSNDRQAGFDLHAMSWEQSSADSDKHIHRWNSLQFCLYLAD